MTEIVFLTDFPQAAKSCSDYMESWWDYPRESAVAAINSCMRSEGLPVVLVAKEGKNLIGFIMATDNNNDYS